MDRDDLGESQSQEHQGDHEGRAITITMLPNRQWRIYYGDEAGGQYVNISEYDAIKDYVLQRRPKSELLTLYPSLRGIENGTDNVGL